MRVAHISMTPVAGACWSWSEAFREAGYESFSICPPGYDGGRTMPTDYAWPPDKKALRALRSADVILAYQGWPYKFEWYPQDKPTVAVYVSQPKPHMHYGAQNDGWPWCVIAEYQTRLYPGCEIVPELIPLTHPWYQPGKKPADRVRIVYSPSNTQHTGWDDKGYEATVEALRRIVEESDGLGVHKPLVEADVMTNASLEDCLKRKSTAHIAIDECATGSYHANSLQGLAHGCVTVNGMDELCAENIRKITGREAPFSVCKLDDLEKALRSLVSLGPDRLEALGRRSRQWMEECWWPVMLVEKWFRPLMERAIAHGRSAAV